MVRSKVHQDIMNHWRQNADPSDGTVWFIIERTESEVLIGKFSGMHFVKSWCPLWTVDRTQPGFYTCQIVIRDASGAYSGWEPWNEES